MVGEATLNTILRLHVGVQLCKRSQKSSRVNLQKSDVQPKPLNRLWVGRSKKNLQRSADEAHSLKPSDKRAESLAFLQRSADEDTVGSRNSGRGAIFKPSSSMRTKENSRKEKNNEDFLFSSREAD